MIRKLLILLSFIALSACASTTHSPRHSALPEQVVCDCMLEITNRAYLVFFDWNKSDLQPEAKKIIAQAASYGLKVAYGRTEVDGFADTSGNPAYNLVLSKRRALAVAAQLVADGYPAAEISVKAYGNTKLLVPTNPGVRNEQNRSAIIFVYDN